MTPVNVLNRSLISYTFTEILVNSRRTCAVEQDENLELRST